MAVNERSYEAVKPIAVDVLGGDNLDEVWSGIEMANQKHRLSGKTVNLGE